MIKTSRWRVTWNIKVTIKTCRWRVPWIAHDLSEFSIDVVNLSVSRFSFAFLYPFSQSVFRLALFVVSALPFRDVCFLRVPGASAHSILPLPVFYVLLLPKAKLKLNNCNFNRIKLLKIFWLAVGRIGVNDYQEDL